MHNIYTIVSIHFRKYCVELVSPISVVSLLLYDMYNEYQNDKINVLEYNLVKEMIV